MDEKPFLEISLLDLKDAHIEELKKFHKSYFDIEAILSSASELKYTGELKTIIAREFASPSPDFVKYFGKQAYEGAFTAKVLEVFTYLVKRSITSYINDMISDRLKAAIKEGDTESEKDTELKKDNAGKPEKLPDGVIYMSEDGATVTTQEEMEAFYIVKSILRNTIQSDRITYRDAQSYFAIFIDDNNRKTVCRLHLNSPTNKRLTFLDENRKEQHNKIASIDEIYNYSEQLIDVVSKFL
jgi:hypothetical protein